MNFIKFSLPKWTLSVALFSFFALNGLAQNRNQHLISNLETESSTFKSNDEKTPAKSACDLNVSVGANDSICRGKSKTITATTTGGVLPITFAWSNGSVTPSVSAALGGSFSVTATDATGCTAVATKSVTVLDTAVFSIQIRPDTNIFLSCRNKNVIVKAQPDGVVPVVGFNWSTGATNIQFIEPQTPGLYTVTVTAQNGCQSVGNQLVTQDITPPNLTLTRLGPNDSLSCQITTIFLEAAAPSSEFLWNTGSIATTIAATTAGNFIVTATSQINGCTASASKQIFYSNTSNLVVDAGIDVTICKGKTTTLTAASALGTAPYTFNWSGGTPSVKPTITTNYMVTATDANGCSATDTKTVFVLDTAAFIVQIRPDTNIFLSCKNKNVIVKAQPDGVVPVVGFNWSNGATNIQFIEPQTPGLYTVTVTAQNGCQSVGNQLVTQDITPPNLTLTRLGPNDSLSCQITTIFLEAAAPSSEFLWNTGSIATTIAATTAGNFIVTATSQINGCTASASKQIFYSNTSNLVVDAGIDVTICKGKTTTLTATSALGTAPYTYAWSGGTPSVKPTITTNYMVTATDANGCSATDTKTVFVLDTAAFFVQIRPDTNIFLSCKNKNVIVKAQPDGVVPVVGFNWSNGATNIQFIEPQTPGLYTVTVTAQNGCQSVGNQLVTQDITPPNLTLTRLGPNDSLTCQITTIFLEAAALSSEFLWNTGSIATTIAATTAGNFIVTATSQINGCTASASKQIFYSNTSNLVVDAGIDVTICKGKTTTLTATSALGTAPYTYAWSGGTPSVKPTITTNYTVTATDANGCSATDTKTVFVLDTAAFFVQIRPDTNIFLSCRNKNVIVKAQPDGVVPVVGFNWSTGVTNIQFIEPQTPGLYTVTVTAQNGCQSVGNQLVTQDITPPNLTLTRLGPNDSLSCQITTIFLEAAAPSSEFLWNTGSVATTIAATAAGNYGVTATSQINGCTATASKQIFFKNNAASLSTSFTPTLCNGDKSTATLTAVGSGSLQFSKNGGTTWQTSNVFNNLAANTYTFAVRSASLPSCVSTQVVDISQPTKLLATVEKTNVTCSGNIDGRIKITASGGTGLDSFSVNNGSIYFSNNTFGSLISGNYKVRVKDANGCTTAAQTVNLTQPTAINFNVSQVNISCYGLSDGKITIKNRTGGNGSPYQFSKDDGATWQADTIFSGLSATIYNVKVKDVNGCTSTMKAASISQPTPISFGITKQDITCSNATGVVGISLIGGGTTPYKYSKDGGLNFQTSSIFINLPVGTYSIQVKDLKNCLSSVENASIVNNCTPSGAGNLSARTATQFVPVVFQNIYPNPAESYLIIDLSSKNEKEVEFQFFNVIGKVVKAEKRNLEKGENHLEFDCSTLPSGVYQVNTSLGAGRNTPTLFVKL